MQVYTVHRQNKFDHDCSVELLNLGCYADKGKAMTEAKKEYERMQGEYEDDMLHYSDTDVYDPDEYDSGALYVEADDEDGFYFISFGAKEYYESHIVWVDKWEVQE